MSLSVVSLLASNFLLLLNVLYFNSSILSVLLIFFIEILITVLLQISKIVYIYIVDKNQFVDSGKKTYVKSCFFVILFGSFIFAAIQGVSMSQYLLSFVFTDLNYQIDINMILTFAIIFTLSHLVSYKVNFIDKLPKETPTNLSPSVTPEAAKSETTTSEAEEFQSNEQILDIAKILTRIQSLTLISVVSVFFVAILRVTGLTNYMNYFVVIYCLIKTYFDYISHIQQHDLKNFIKNK